MKVGTLIRILILGGFLTCLVFGISDTETYGLMFMGVGFLYIFYWVDIFAFNSTFKSLRNIKVIHNVYEHIEDVKANGVPTINFKMECYHFETRYRTVYYTDSNGNSRSRTETYQEKVVTSRPSTNFIYATWTDQSENIFGLEEYAYTRVHFKKQYILADEETKIDFNQQKANFIDRNKNNDTHYSYFESFDISGYVEWAISTLNNDVPWVMNVYWYLFFCLFMMELFYSYWLVIYSGKKGMTFIKVLRSKH